MRAFILSGADTPKDTFVKKYITDNKIAPYNVHWFDSELKIAQAREIKKILSLSPIGSGKRLIIITQPPTIEAQNALLKTVEELPESSDIIFFSDKNLLPTITSRAVIVRLDNNSEREISGNIEHFVKFLSRPNHTTDEILLFSESLFSEKDENINENIILSLRKILLQKIESRDLSNIKNVWAFLKEYSRYSGLISSNNLNPRITTDKILIKLFSAN